MIEEILEGNDYVSAKEYLVAKPAPPVDSAGSPAHAGDGDDPPPDGEAEEEGPRFGLVTIYPKGSEPKRTAKKEPAYHTGNDSIAAGSKIIATVQKITEEKTTSRSRGSEYRTRNIKKAYIPRLVFMAGPSHNFKDATILFEYFTRQGNTRRIVKSDRARIPMLQSMKYMVADAEGYANVITKTAGVEEYAGSPSRSSEKPEYYGFIASIYDREGTMIFQRCTNRSLAEFGKSRLEMLR
jgi:hypothetical protein